MVLLSLMPILQLIRQANLRILFYASWSWQIFYESKGIHKQIKRVLRKLCCGQLGTSCVLRLTVLPDKYEYLLHLDRHPRSSFLLKYFKKANETFQMRYMHFSYIWSRPA